MELLRDMEVLVAAVEPVATIIAGAAVAAAIVVAVVQAVQAQAILKVVAVDRLIVVAIKLTP